MPGTRFVFNMASAEGASNGGHGNSSSASPEQLVEGLAKVAGRETSEVAGWMGRGAEFDAQEAAACGLIDTVSTDPVLPAATQFE